MVSRVGLLPKTIANGIAKPVPFENPAGTQFADEELVKDILTFRESKIGK